MRRAKLVSIPLPRPVRPVSRIKTKSPRINYTPAPNPNPKNRPRNGYTGGERHERRAAGRPPIDTRRATGSPYRAIKTTFPSGDRNAALSRFLSPTKWPTNPLHTAEERLFLRRPEIIKRHKTKKRNGRRRRESARNAVGTSTVGARWDAASRPHTNQQVGVPAPGAPEPAVQSTAGPLRLAVHGHAVTALCLRAFSRRGGTGAYLRCCCHRRAGRGKRKA